MKIIIQTFGQIRSITKEQFIELELDEKSTVAQAIRHFTEKFGPDVQKLLFHEGKFRDFYTVMINKNSITREKINTYKLSEGNEISLIPFVAGGM